MRSKGLGVETEMLSRKARAVGMRVIRRDFSEEIKVSSMYHEY